MYIHYKNSHDFYRPLFLNPPVFPTCTSFPTSSPNLSFSLSLPELQEQYNNSTSHIPPTKNFSLELTLALPQLSLSLSLSERNVYIDHRAPLSDSVAFQLQFTKQAGVQPTDCSASNKKDQKREKETLYTNTKSCSYSHMASMSVWTFLQAMCLVASLSMAVPENDDDEIEVGYGPNYLNEIIDEDQMEGE